MHSPCTHCALTVHSPCTDCALTVHTVHPSTHQAPVVHSTVTGHAHGKRTVGTAKGFAATRSRTPGPSSSRASRLTHYGSTYLLLTMGLVTVADQVRRRLRARAARGHIRLQPLSHTVAASITYGCRFVDGFAREQLTSDAAAEAFGGVQVGADTLGWAVAACASRAYAVSGGARGA